MKISDILIGRVLLIGVLISASVVFFGGTLFLIQHGIEIHSNPIFSKTQVVFSFHSMMVGILHLEPRSLIMLGLFTLLLTQWVRVFLTAWYFIEKKEKFYFWTSIFVFVMLIYSIWNGS